MNLLCSVVAHDVDPEAVGGRGRRDGAHPQRGAVVRGPVIGRGVISPVGVTWGRNFPNPAWGPVFPAGGCTCFDWINWTFSTTVQGGAGGLMHGCVDIDLGHSTVCLVLLGQMELHS